MTMPKDIERIAYLSPEQIHDAGGSPPRWTPGSLAQHLAQWHPDGHRAADAVQRLAVAARACLEDSGNSIDLSLALEAELRAAIDAAEGWGR